ncbi:GmrSD restriction endonuclease domain-containing protein [Citricoccus muralis]|uniref:Uncharacterized protein DUF262 n=1 Tax=Citricoccus muralis TaxID=169134 RepID=A0A3D9LFH1_9MICC|nr:DUF262 domain-containing protein [Citricoccus muralis]REE04157.1 uncharacterized protein DUF262 [Citricoccus muralis]
MALIEEIEKRSREIKTDGYSMSIGEMMSLYKDGDLDVHPEFQRIFRWSEEQKARLIESILLGIPVPTIFVSQRPDGVWDVIDGVQRLSTLLQFVGVYLSEDGEQVEAEPLRSTEYLPSLGGYVWENDQEGVLSFDEVQRRDFKRAKLDFRIIKKESDKDAKYDLFQRLNSGTELSAQEARDCLLVMLNASMYRWLVQLSTNDKFKNTVPLTSRKEDEGFRQELVLRFHLYKDFDGGKGELQQEFGEYLTSWMRESAESKKFDLSAHEKAFNDVFKLLDTALGEDAFRRFDSDKNRFLGAFSISAFESIVSGLAQSYGLWKGREPEELAGRIKAMWGEEYFRDNSGTGVSARRRMPRLVHFGRGYFA